MNNNEPPVRTSFNIDYVKEHISKFNDIINNMKNQGNMNTLDHELAILDKYPEFYQSYPFLVKKVCKGDNLDELEVMFNKLKSIESGEKSLASVELKYGQELKTQYLDPVIKK